MVKSRLRDLPSVDSMLQRPALKDAANEYSRAHIVDAIRETLSSIRDGISSGRRDAVTTEGIEAGALERLNGLSMPGVKKVINATGTILHTNLGRAVLPGVAVTALKTATEGPINLEFDLLTGGRGSRDSLAEGLIKRFTNAEAASIVNNNAAAVFITLNTLAEGKEVVVSRGELVEIGGSFRLHEIIKKSGAVLREVGASNRTHPEDYEKAITENTACLFKAHRSNFTINGFTSEVKLKELSAIGKRRGVPVVEDLGSGSLIDLSVYGLPKEPVVGERLESGADVVTFSGDKLLGGPQAGIIAGRKGLIDRIDKNPLKRVLRPDKLTLSALWAVLRLYLKEETLTETLPTLRFMTRPIDGILKGAERAAMLLKDALGEGFIIEVKDSMSVVGGGSMPGRDLPTKAVSITHETLSPERIFRLFLLSDPPVVGRIDHDEFLLNLRTVERPEDVVPRRLVEKDGAHV